jgi:hypothetical protein
LSNVGGQGLPHQPVPKGESGLEGLLPQTFPIFQQTIPPFSPFATKSIPAKSRHTNRSKKPIPKGVAFVGMGGKYVLNSHFRYPVESDVDCHNVDIAQGRDQEWIQYKNGKKGYLNPVTKGRNCGIWGGRSNRPN